MAMNNLVSIRRLLLMESLLLCTRWMRAHCKCECRTDLLAWLLSLWWHPRTKMLMGRAPCGSFAKTISEDNVGMNAQGGLWLHHHIWEIVHSSEIKTLKMRMEECKCYGESDGEHEEEENQRSSPGLRPSKCFDLQSATEAFCISSI